MFSIPNVSDQTVEFLTESTYGDTYREIIQLPPMYAWLKTLMRIKGKQVADELTKKRLAVTTSDGRVLVNMTKLPELAELIDEIERRW